MQFNQDVVNFIYHLGYVDGRQPYSKATATNFEQAENYIPPDIETISAMMSKHAEEKNLEKFICITVKSRDLANFLYMSLESVISKAMLNGTETHFSRETRAAEFKLYVERNQSLFKTAIANNLACFAMTVNPIENAKLGNGAFQSKFEATRMFCVEKLEVFFFKSEDEAMKARFECAESDHVLLDLVNDDVTMF